jgi:hypothetical protein
MLLRRDCANGFQQDNEAMRTTRSEVRFIWSLALGAAFAMAFVALLAMTQRMGACG